MAAPDRSRVGKFGLGGLYLALILWPGYLAGGASGEDITAGRLGAYAGALVVSAAVGWALNREWMYALPWVVWGGWTWVETGLRVFTESRIFEPADAPIGIAMLAVGESLALWAGAWSAGRRRKSSMADGN